MSILQPSPSSFAPETSKWKNYWEKDSFWAGSALWNINADLFFKKSRKFLDLREDDEVLDIGCGPGLTAAKLAPFVKSITAVDYSESMVSLAKENCAAFSNVAPLHSSEDFESRGPFTLILCISVVQYFPSYQEIEEWILKMKSLCRPGARLLIADLPLKRNFWGAAYDFLCSLFLSIREGYFLEFLRTSVQLFHKSHPYRKFSAQNPALSFSRAWCLELIQKLGLNATIFMDSLSVCSNRPSLFIQF